MPNRNRIERLQVMFSALELEVIEDFRFEHRLPSRASAIREIMRRGLVASKRHLIGPNVEEDPHARSADFGVIEKGSSRSAKRNGSKGNDAAGGNEAAG